MPKHPANNADRFGVVWLCFRASNRWNQAEMCFFCCLSASQKAVTLAVSECPPRPSMMNILLLIIPKHPANTTGHLYLQKCPWWVRLMTITMTIMKASNLKFLVQSCFSFSFKTPFYSLNINIESVWIANSDSPWNSAFKTLFQPCVTIFLTSLQRTGAFVPCLLSGGSSVN